MRLYQEGWRESIEKCLLVMQEHFNNAQGALDERAKTLIDELTSITLTIRATAGGSLDKKSTTAVTPSIFNPFRYSIITD